LCNTITRWLDVLTKKAYVRSTGVLYEHMSTYRHLLCWGGLLWQAKKQYATKRQRHMWGQRVYCVDIWRHRSDIWRAKVLKQNIHLLTTNVFFKKYKTWGWNSLIFFAIYGQNKILHTQRYIKLSYSLRRWLQTNKRIFYSSRSTFLT